MNHSASECCSYQTKYNFRKEFCLETRTKNNRLHIRDSLTIQDSIEYEQKLYKKIHTVKARMNSHDPRKPPTMVLIWVAAKNGLYICIAEKRSTENMEDKAKETPLDAPVRKTQFLGTAKQSSYTKFLVLNWDLVFCGLSYADTRSIMSSNTRK